jgi:hypothetical protein
VGLFLLAVPTIYTVFPGLTLWSERDRLLVLGVWAALGAITIAAQSRRDETITDLAADTDSERRKVRRASAAYILEQLLREGTGGVPAGYVFMVYIADGDYMRPVWPALQLRPGEQDPRVFKIGNGATGSAWEQDKTFVVTGEMVHNERHGLTPEQQEYFKDFHTVAATPSTFAESRIGVLTALGPNDDGFFNQDSPGGRMLLERLAQIVGVVLKLIEGTPVPPT